MGKYDWLSDKERRKLYRDLSRAAKEIQVRDERVSDGRGEPAEGEPRAEEHRAEQWSRQRSYRRPRWAVRVRIESYSYAEGFAISGLRQYLGSLLAFLWPRRDPVNPLFVKQLVQNSPYRADPAGYSLGTCLWELERIASSLLSGGLIFKRDSDHRAGVRRKLTRDLLNWEPSGYRFLKELQAPARKATEPLDYVRARFDAQREVDAFDLADTTRAVYRLAYLTDAPSSVLREHLEVVGELNKGLFKRLATQQETIRRVSARVDHHVLEFMALFERLRRFARELYPVMLKLLGEFRRYERIDGIMPRIYEFVGLGAGERIVMYPLSHRITAPTAPAGQQEPWTEAPPEEAGQGTETGEEIEKDAAAAAGDGGEGQVAAEDTDAESADENGGELQLSCREILTILEDAFPGSRLEKIPEGDFSSLFWFQNKVFTRREVRSPLITRRQDFTDLLSKVSRRDPLAPVFVLYEVVRQMLESLNADAVGRLEDPLVVQAGKTQERFSILRSQWNVVREELFVRYLQELDYYEREATLRAREPTTRFQDTAAGRRSVETINQIRNHVIRGYGHIATLMDRREVFRCPPLYSLAQELCRLFETLTPERRQSSEGNPIAARRLGGDDLVVPRSGLIPSQIESYIKAVPGDRRVLEEPVAEHNRLFLGILLGTLDLLRTLLNAEGGPLRDLGGEVVYADRQDQALREEIARDTTSLRVELRRDFEEVDRLTGLISKSEYLRFAPGLFHEVRESGGELTFLVLDMDNFKAVNEALGHAVGDEMLRTAARAILSTGRAEDPAVRFGGDELIVIVRGDYAAGYQRAERIRSRFAEVVQGELAEKLGRVPALMAQKELVEKKRQDPLYRGGLEELAGRWKRLSVGTLSIGAAQGLGSQLQHPCAEVSELFRRADAMLYLAKESGGNHTVVMVDPIEIPLTGNEFRELKEFWSGKDKPLATLEGYVDYRRSTGRPSVFGGYSYDGYLNPT